MSFKEYCESGKFLQNNFNETIEGFLLGPDIYSNPLNIFQRIVFGILFSFLSVVSVIGNGLALFTISKRRLQVLYRCCVVSQCVGDILMAVFVCMNSLSNFIQETIEWKFGNYMCGWIPYVTTTSALLSSMILTCIALDRYQGVILLSGKWDPKFPTAALIVGCLWLTAAGTTVPTFLSYSQMPACFINFEANTSIYAQLCLVNQTISNYYFFTVFAFIFLPLLIAFIIVYGAIARMMLLKKRKENSGSIDKVSVSASTLDTIVDTYAGPQVLRGSQAKGKAKSAHSQKKVRTFTIILIIMATFIVCRLPQWIFIVITMVPQHQGTGSHWWNVKYLLSALSLANTSINPFIYSFLNEVMNLKSNLTIGMKNFKNFRFKNIKIKCWTCGEKREDKTCC